MSVDVSADVSPGVPSQPPARTGPVGLFRAFWRWHFYASFLVIPIFAMLAVTGLIYLFRFQIEPVLHHDVMRASAPAGAQYQQPLSTQLAAAQQAHPDATFELVREGRGAEDTTAFSFTNPDGSTTDVFVDPWRSTVLGSLDPDTTLSGYAVRLHGDLMAGRWGDGLIEVAACWAIVMALTGYALFVSGRKARLRRMAKAVTGAATRHRHGLIGAVTGIGLLAMVVTGLPWTGFWGEKVQSFATAHGSSLWSTDPGAASEPGSTLDESLPHSHAVEIPWAQQDSTVPTSGPDRQSVADVDTAVAVAEKQGLKHPLAIVLPGDGASAKRGVYSVMGDAFGDPTAEKTVHVDRYSGQVRATYGFADYPLAAQVVSQGIGVHEGRSFGMLNLIASAVFCLLVLALCVTGPLMWWRRRPSGSLGAPRGRLPVRSTWWLGAGLVVLGVLLPLFGVTLLAVLLLDQLVIRRFAVTRRWFSAATG